MPFFSFDSKKTFKELRAHKGTKVQLHIFQKNTLENGDLITAIRCPSGTDLDDWISLHVVDFYNEASLIYGLVVDECTCVSMTAGPSFEYLWSNDASKVPIRITAHEYVDKLLNWYSTLLDDQSIFPSTTIGYPKSFRKTVHNMLRRIFRVYAHIYHHHLHTIDTLEARGHLDISFKRFVLFTTMHNILTTKDMAPLESSVLELVTSSSKS